jgi:hypothetical protein
MVFANQRQSGAGGRREMFATNDNTGSGVFFRGVVGALDVLGCGQVLPLRPA